MNFRAQQFVREYLIDLNGAAAARRAGYSPHSAGRRAFELLERPDVKTALRRAMADRARRTDITADRVLEELARIAFADLSRLADWGPDGVRLKPANELREEDTAAVAFVSLGGRNKTQRIRMHNKISALVALARHMGLLRDGRKTVDRDLGPDAVEAMKARHEEQRALADRARAKLMRVVEDYARECEAKAKA
jgi:phage terminase small subunit